MLKDSYAFSGFSVDNLARAKAFYADELGLEVKETAMGLELSTKGNQPIFIYEKADHAPASFTILNFPVDDIDAAMDELIGRGVDFEFYDNLPAKQDEKGVLRGKAAGQGPDIAWMKDSAGNILSILSN